MAQNPVERKAVFVCPRSDCGEPSTCIAYAAIFYICDSRDATGFTFLLFNLYFQLHTYLLRFFIYTEETEDSLKHAQCGTTERLEFIYFLPFIFLSAMRASIRLRHQKGIIARNSQKHQINWCRAKWSRAHIRSSGATTRPNGKIIHLEFEAAKKYSKFVSAFEVPRSICRLTMTFLLVLRSFLSFLFSVNGSRFSRAKTRVLVDTSPLTIISHAYEMVKVREPTPRPCRISPQLFVIDEFESYEGENDKARGRMLNHGEIRNSWSSPEVSGGVEIRIYKQPYEPPSGSSRREIP